ncbi:hypothetical protein J6590_054754 [Homalodisca vitripennis]|nr:hypothetical protein J6590_054754 [Homalodisca vitripennis]
MPLFNGRINNKVLYNVAVYKTGECPQLTQEASHCSQECTVDADCSGTAKCCYNGCGTSCLEPVSEAPQTAAPTPETYHPGS